MQQIVSHKSARPGVKSGGGAANEKGFQGTCILLS